MPKLPPPPRTAQKRSLFSSHLAVFTSPNAVTISTDTRPSTARPHFAAQIVHPAHRVQPADASVGDVACRRDEAEELRLPVDVGKPRAALHVHCHRLAVDPDLWHLQVDDDPAIAHRAAADVVTATAHADQKCVRAGEVDGRDDIRQAAGLGDQDTRSPVVRLFQTRRASVMASSPGARIRRLKEALKAARASSEMGCSHGCCEVNGIPFAPPLRSSTIATNAKPRRLRHQCPIVRSF